MKKSKLPYTTIAAFDGKLCYAGVVQYHNTIDICCHNSKEVEDAFRKLFKEGDIVDVVIEKKR